MRQLLLTLLLAIMFGPCFGQIAKLNEGHTLRDMIEADTLVDNELRMRFVLDSARINISAYDFSNNLVWSVDPWLANKLIEYRLNGR